MASRQKARRQQSAAKKRRRKSTKFDQPAYPAVASAGAKKLKEKQRKIAKELLHCLKRSGKYEGQGKAIMTALCVIGRSTRCGPQFVKQVHDVGSRDYWLKETSRSKFPKRAVEVRE